MKLLEQMEQVLREEHTALVRGDWQTLRSCAEEKEQLSQELARTELEPPWRDRVRSVRRSVQYNAELASTLSTHVSAILAHQRQAPPTYDGRGRVAHRPQAAISLRG